MFSFRLVDFIVIQCQGFVLYIFPSNAYGRTNADVRIVAEHAVVFSDLDHTKGDGLSAFRHRGFHGGICGLCVGAVLFVGFSGAHGCASALRVAVMRVNREDNEYLWLIVVAESCIEN